MKQPTRKREQGRRRQNGEQAEEQVNLLDIDESTHHSPSLSSPSEQLVDTLLSGVVITVALSVYLYTAYPSIAGGMLMRS